MGIRDYFLEIRSVWSNGRNKVRFLPEADLELHLTYQGEGRQAHFVAFSANGESLLEALPLL